MTGHRVQPSASGFTELQTATLASLPETFQAASRGSVRLIDGGPGWTERAANEIGSEVRALIVDRPSPGPIEPVRALRELARSHDVVVAVDSPYVSSPVWGVCRERVVADAAGAGLVDSVVTVQAAEDLERGLLAQIAVVRPLVRGATVRRASPGSTTLVTKEGGLAVSLSACVSVSPGLVLDLVGPQLRWRIELPDDGTARPGRAARYDALGETALRPIYSTPSRSTWQALADRLSGSAAAIYDLDAFLLDLDVLAGT